MPYEIEIRTLEPQPTAVIRTSCAAAELSTALGQILPEVYAYLQQQGVTPVGPPFTRYLSVTGDRFEIEGGMPVAAPITGEGRVVPSELPGGSVAVTNHFGPYETLSQAYQAMEQWFSQQNRRPAAAPWETYWTDPEAEPDPQKWRTEVHFPLP